MTEIEDFKDRQDEANFQEAIVVKSAIACI